MTNLTWSKKKKPSTFRSLSQTAILHLTTFLKQPYFPQLSEYFWVEHVNTYVELLLRRGRVGDVYVEEYIDTRQVRQTSKQNEKLQRNKNTENKFREWDENISKINECINLTKVPMLSKFFGDFMWK